MSAQHEALAGGVAERRIRTFHGRHRRTTPRMEEVLAGGPSLADRPDGDRPVVLEVGCGHGEAALAYALHRPDLDVVAADVHGPGVAHLAAAVGDAGVTNLFVERGDALELLDGPLRAADLCAVHLFFPDPWPKTRHHKRRFVRPDVLDLLADRMAPGGSLLVATDVDEYAAWALRHLDRHPAFDGGISSRPAWRPVTRYEAAARRAGRPVTELHHRLRRAAARPTGWLPSAPWDSSTGSRAAPPPGRTP